MKYTDRVDGFQICDVTYWPGLEPKTILPIYHVVKHETTEPTEVIDMSTGEKKISTENNYAVASLVWDSHESAFNFRSIGLRWLEANPSQAVINMIVKFVEEKTEELSNINEEIVHNQSWETYADYCVCPFCRKQTGSAYKFCPYCGRRVYSRY